jgi:hypothetical protein
MTARYRFLPWVRLGASASTTDSLGAGVPTRATIPVHLRVNGRDDVRLNARLHGPGDVVSIDTRMVVRTDPPHLTSEFEPNYFPLVEFDRPDIPWLFTPATGTRSGRLRPWLVLVTVRRQPGVTIAVNPASRRPVLRIEAPAIPRLELPDLADSWAWAHAQVVDPDTGAALADLLAAHSTQNLSRLVCPRRLQPDTSYLSCVVPAFDVGRRSGLGLTITAADDKELLPSWKTGADAPSSIDLPVLYHWEFSTGDAGDFESLALRLRPSPAPEGLGLRPLDVSGLGFDIPDLGITHLGGALHPIDVTQPGPLPSSFIEFTEALRTVLDLPAARADGGSVDPVVGPPVYGSRQAAQPSVAGAAPWLATLNLDPRLRAAAGLGSTVVQDQQEHLMAAAWEQLGRAATATRALRQPVFGRAVLGRVHTRLALLDADSLLTVAGPLMTRVQVPATADIPVPGGAVTTLAHRLRATRTPATLMSGAFRRAVRPHGPLARRSGGVGQAATPRPTMRFVDEIARRGTVIFSRVPRSDMVTPAILNASFDGLIIPSLPERIRQGSALRQAFAEVATYYERVAGIPPLRETRPPLVAAAVHSQLLLQLDPERTVPPAVLPPAAASPAPPGGVAPPVPAAAGLSGPTFTRPMYEPLRDLDPQFLLPGSDRVLADTVVLLASDASFIEAYMTGLNHEMSRELLWREYPSDERSTSFRVFWQPAGFDPRSHDQLPPLHEWRPDSELGAHFMAGTGDNLVVLVRGELFTRYPGATVYLTRSTRPGDAGSERVLPLFRGEIGADMTFLGFGVAANQLTAERWFVVFEQQPTEPRFGLDAATATGRPLADIKSWDHLSWGDVAADAEELEALVHLPLGGRLAGHRAGEIEWVTNGGHMAAITLQRSFRIARPLTDLVPM